MMLHEIFWSPLTNFSSFYTLINSFHSIFCDFLSCVSQAHAVHIYKCLLLTLQKEWCTVNRPLHESLLLWFEHISQRVCMGNSKPSTTRLRGGGSTSMDGLMPIIKEHEAGSSVSCPCLHFILPPWEATVRRPLPDASPSVLDVSASRTVSQ